MRERLQGVERWPGGGAGALTFAAEGKDGVVPRQLRPQRAPELYGGGELDVTVEQDHHLRIGCAHGDVLLELLADGGEAARAVPARAELPIATRPRLRPLASRVDSFVGIV